MRLARLAVLGLAATALLLPASALANWQYTRWGMTVDQVIAASKGRVTVLKGDAGDRILKKDLGAQGEVTFEKRAWTAQFYFDEAGGLAVVRMGLKDNAECDAMKAENVAKYGPLDEHTHGDWQDKKTGDNVFMSDNRKYDIPCYLMFSKP